MRVPLIASRVRQQGARSIVRPPDTGARVSDRVARHRRVRHAGRRRQGQGAEGGRRARHRLRRRRARLPHARPHRRGRRRGLPRPEEPPVQPRPAACPSSRRRSPPRRRATRATTSTAAPGARHQRRQARRLQHLRHPARPGRRGAPARAVLDHLSRADHARRRRRRSSCPTDEATGFRVTVDQLEAARTERTKALMFVSPSNPTGAVYPRGRDRGDRPLGRRARHLGRHRRDLRAPHLRRPRVPLDAGRRARAGRPLRRRSTAWPRPTR